MNVKPIKSDKWWWIQYGNRFTVSDANDGKCRCDTFEYFVVVIMVADCRCAGRRWDFFCRCWHKFFDGESTRIQKRRKTKMRTRVYNCMIFESRTCLLHLITCSTLCDDFNSFLLLLLYFGFFFSNSGILNAWEMTWVSRFSFNFEFYFWAFGIRIIVRLNNCSFCFLRWR